MSGEHKQKPPQEQRAAAPGCHRPENLTRTYPVAATLGTDAEEDRTTKTSVTDCVEGQAPTPVRDDEETMRRNQEVLEEALPGGMKVPKPLQAWDEVTNPEGPYHNEACANCGVPRDLHKEPGDLPSGSLHATWGDVDSCRDFQRCDPPRAAYGPAWWAEREDDADETPRVVIKGDNPIHGTLLYIDGFEVPHLTNVTFSHPAGEIARVEAETALLDGFRLEVRANVEVKVHVNRGDELVIDELADGRISYKAVCSQEGFPGDAALRMDLEALAEACAAHNEAGPERKGELGLVVTKTAQNVAVSYELLKEREGGRATEPAQNDSAKGNEGHRTVLPHPFCEGYEAHLNGLYQDANPHPSRSEPNSGYQLWNEGWWCARRHSEGNEKQGGAS